MVKINIKNGFTLVEILVVLAIISILTAILFPVFAAVREKARRAVCIDHIGQLGLAIKLYSDDHNEAYPYAFIDMRDSGYYYAEFVDIMMPYVKNMEVFFCPSGTQKMDKKLTEAENRERAKNGNYSTNRALLPYCTQTQKPLPVYIYSVKAEAEVYAVYDGSYTSMSASDITLCGDMRAFLPGSGATNGKAFVRAEGTTPQDEVDYMKGRHDKGVNMAYADGHMKYLKSKVVWDQIFASPSPWKPEDWL